MELCGWTVDYHDGNGPHPVDLPHAWRQDVPVDFEGPVTYFLEVEVPRAGGWLWFEAVSYSCRVVIDEVEVGRHEGMWDAFSVSLEAYRGRTVGVTVEVTKAGGPSFPASSVASGVLPYLHHTFGGIWGQVLLCATDPLAELPGPAESRVTGDGRRLLLDGAPFYARAVVHQGWYPELGHCRPSRGAFEAELASMVGLGFNVVKFSGWMPPHEALEAISALGLVAWLELPLLRPKNADWERLCLEMERLVRQYRRHTCVGFWSVGSDFGTAVPAWFRERLVRMVLGLSGCSLVSESGSPEDPRDFGSFASGPDAGAHLGRRPMLVELEEVEHHRDLSRLVEDHPYWASGLPEFNSIGLRTSCDLPEVLRTSRFAHEPRASGHEALMRASCEMGAAVRARDVALARQVAGASGFVSPVWRDTPISASGFVDDWGNRRYSVSSLSSLALFLVPGRTRDEGHVWTGPNLWRIGIHSDRDVTVRGIWRLRFRETVIAEGALCGLARALEPVEVAEAYAELAEPGEYELWVEANGVEASWRIWAVSRSGPVGPREFVLDAGLAAEANQFGLRTPFSREVSGNSVRLLAQDWPEAGVRVCELPFWRGATYECCGQLPFSRTWERLLDVAADRALSTPESADVLVRRIDTQTYAETAIVARLEGGAVVTSLGLRLPLASHPGSVQLLRDLSWVE